MLTDRTKTVVSEYQVFLHLCAEFSTLPALPALLSKLVDHLFARAHPNVHTVRRYPFKTAAEKI